MNQANRYRLYLAVRDIVLPAFRNGLKQFYGVEEEGLTIELKDNREQVWYGVSTVMNQRQYKGMKIATGVQPNKWHAARVDLFTGELLGKALDGEDQVVTPRQQYSWKDFLLDAGLTQVISE